MKQKVSIAGALGQGKSQGYRQAPGHVDLVRHNAKLEF